MRSSSDFSPSSHVFQSDAINGLEKCLRLKFRRMRIKSNNFITIVKTRKRITESFIVSALALISLSLSFTVAFTAKHCLNYPKYFRSTSSFVYNLTHSQKQNNEETKNYDTKRRTRWSPSGKKGVKINSCVDLKGFRGIFRRFGERRIQENFCGLERKRILKFVLGFKAIWTFYLLCN